mgnify:CR=1 FL=1
MTSILDTLINLNIGGHKPKKNIQQNYTAMGPREMIVAILCLPFMSVSPAKMPYEELLICVTYKYNIMGMLYMDVSQILLRYIKNG